MSATLPSTRQDPDAWALIQAVMFTNEGKCDPYPYYRRLHERGAEFVAPDGTHIVIGYEAVTEMMRSPLFTRTNQGHHVDADPVFTTYGLDELTRLKALEDTTTPFLTALDPPDHTRLRALVQRTFMPRHIDAMRGAILAEIDRLLARIDPTVPVDMTGSFGVLFAPEIVGELIGLPSAQRETVSNLTGKLMRGLDPGVDFATCLEGVRASAAQRDYVAQVIADRRVNPRDDLVTALATAPKTEISEVELIRLVQILYVGGYETTAHMIGNGLVALLRNPDQFVLLRENLETMIRPAVEEMLRYDGPISLSHNYAAAGATLGGAPADAGSVYLAMLTAANRDPAAFPDPDRFDITRQRKPLMSFGTGAHFCLGINLAKLELGLVFKELIARFPRMRLAEAAPPRSPTFHQQSYERVMILLEPPSQNQLIGV